MAITENPQIINNPLPNNETWIQIGPEGTIIRINEQNREAVLASLSTTNYSQTTVPVQIPSGEGTTLLVEPHRLVSVQEQIDRQR